MQLKMVSRGKTKMKLELAGESHTFADLLRNELSNDKKVASVSYHKPHPELGNPVLILETDGEDPVATVKRASKNLAEHAKEMRTEFEKSAKRA